MNDNPNALLLEVQSLTKAYPGVVALDNVDLDVRYGEVHCLAGENGAGKSTLIEIVGGTIAPDSGEIRFEGTRVSFESPRSAQDKGIAVLHQELPALPDLTVAENIYLSRLPRTRLGVVDYRSLHREADYWLEFINSGIDSRAVFGDLPVAKQQLVSIAKALSLDAKVIIFDEPSAVLTLIELERLFEIIKNLRKDGKGIVYISHRLDEIFEIGDRVTVLRNGAVVATNPTSDIDKNDLIRHMVGREVHETRLRQRFSPAQDGTPVLEVKNVTRRGVLENVSFSVSAGEIVGIFGLVGAGRTEVARAIVGADAVDEGVVTVAGTELRKHNPKRTLRYGACLIPEDRKLQGLLLDKSVRENVALPSLRDLTVGRVLLDRRAITVRARDFTEKLKIATPGIEQRSKFLSGGNQQKVVLAKWLSRNMELFIFDEPTRGVDVGAKEEIRRLIVDLAESGKAVILISSEIPEILMLSDRVLVMHSGRITGNVPVTEASQEALLAYSMGSN